VVEPRFADLLPGPPWIDSLILFEKAELRGLRLPGGLWRLRAALRAVRPDVALDLQGLLKSSLVCVLSGAPRRLVYCEPREGSWLFSRPVVGPNADGHVIERYRDVARALAPVPEGRLRFPLPDYAKEAALMRGRLDGLGVRGRPAILFPGAGWASKLWPAQNYARLAALLSERGLEVVLGGSAAEAPLIARIAELARPLVLHDLGGATSLRGLMGLTSLAAVCVGADTGPLHVAAAVGAPTVTLFGPSDWRRAGTLGPRAFNVATTADCSPCFKRTCPKTFICMGLIEPERALGAALSAMGADPDLERASWAAVAV
jgi:heptosyltransferase-1